MDGIALNGAVSSADAVVSAVQRVLEAKPAALITDIDGTISPIVPRPQDATVSHKARNALEALSRLALVAVITGREEPVARAMVGAPHLTYIGHYGLDETSAGSLRVDELEGAKAAVRERLGAADLPCVTFEDKGLSFSLHYRHCEDSSTARRRLLDIAEPVAREANARLLEGKQVIEMVPQGLPDKATAIRRLLEEHGINGAIYFGDDISDVVVFREMKRRRDSDGKPSLAVAIVDRETHDSVREAADVAVAGVEMMEEVLVALARSVPEGGE